MMKKTVSGLIFAAALAFVFAGCDTPTSSGSGDPAGNTAVTGVTLDRTNLTVAVGATAPLQATVSPASAANTAVTWATSNEAIATVSTSGSVTGVAEGTATITVSTVDGGKTAACTVIVKSLSSIEITEQPAQKDYFIGDTIDLAGLVVTATWSDGSEEPITGYTPSKSVFEEADAGTGIGTVTITISYGSVTPVSFDVTVRYKITGVTVSPATATVVKGQPKPFEATVTVDQGTAPPATVTAVTWSIVEAKTSSTTETTAGTTIDVSTGTLTVAAGETLNGLTVKAVSTYDTTQSNTATVTLIPMPTSVTASVPEGYSVFIGEELDLTQITVTAVYNDGTPNKPISGITKDNLSKSVFAETDHGTKQVTVTYAELTSAPFTVTVKYKITGVTVSPSTKDFTKGEGGTQSFTAEAAVDKGTSQPDAVKAVTWSIEEAEKNMGTTINESTGALTVAAGETLNGLTVKAVSTYDDTKSGTATVTITRRVASIAVTTQPTKTVYYIGDAIDLTGLVVTATYSDSTEDTVPIANANITNFDTTAVGESKNVTVTYEGKTATFTINVRYKVEEITVVPSITDAVTGQTGIGFSITVQATQGAPTAAVGSVAWSIVTEKANGTTIDASTGALSVAADETAPSLTVKAVFTYDGGKTWEDTATINVGQLINTSNWASTLAAISSATGGTEGSPKVWTLVVQSDFSVTGASAANVTGNYKEVRLKGAKTISLSGTGSIIRTGTGAKVIIDGPTMTGYSPDQTFNTAPVVYVEGGSVELKSGNITGNKNNTKLAVGLGGGVYVASGAAFAMSGGEISGNLDNSQLDGFSGDEARNGGGVCVDGTFTMSGGTIKDNEGHKVGGVWVDGEFTMSGEAEVSGNINGGILVGEDGKFTMSGGKVSGNKILTNEWKESYGGTGVIVRGTFIMNGTAEISGNEDGGVNVAAWPNDGTALLYRGDFTMSGGTISDNSSTNEGNTGGGVAVMGRFKMQGGTIKGNTGAFGGGVFVMSPPIQPAEFTMTDGTINGGTGSEPNTATGQADMIEKSKAGAAVFYMFQMFQGDTDTDAKTVTLIYFYRNTALTGSNPMPASASASIPTSAWGKDTLTAPMGGDGGKENN
jgi:hypothetical protein